MLKMILLVAFLIILIASGLYMTGFIGPVANSKPAINVENKICNEGNSYYETQPGECNSNDQALYCNGATGVLIEDCRKCRCPEGEYCNQYGSCIVPVCGNFIAESGETSENCCIDVGCPNSQLCSDNVCTPYTASCNKIIDNRDDSIKVVFISESYTDFDLFNTHVNNVINDGFHVIEPYKSYIDKFSFYSVETDFNLGCSVNQPKFESITWLERVRTESMVCGTPDKFNSMVKLAETCFPYDSKTDIVVLANAPSQGGGFLNFTSFSSGRYPLVTMHEISHTYGVTDEYVVLYPNVSMDEVNPEWPNCDTEGCPKWCSGEVNLSNPCYEKIQNYKQCLNRAEKDALDCMIEADPSGELTNYPGCDIGIGCEEGVSCIFLCGGLGSGFGYRQNYSSLMNHLTPTLGPAARDEIIKTIEERLK